jgi:predicted nucleic acid-binding protein
LDAVQSADFVCVNAVILGELLSGFSLGRMEASNLQYLEKFLESPRCQVLPMAKETAKRYAHIYGMLRKSGTPVPTNDLWIAATAMEHGLTVVTRDSHFLLIPQVLCRKC